MANINNMDTLDTFLFIDAITSKHNENDNVKVMDMRWFVKNMDDLLENIEKLNTFGIDNTNDETLKNTSSILIDKRFILDVVKSVIVQHVKKTLKSMEENLEYIKKEDKKNMFDWLESWVNVYEKRFSNGKAKEFQNWIDTQPMCR